MVVKTITREGISVGNARNFEGLPKSNRITDAVDSNKTFRKTHCWYAASGDSRMKKVGGHCGAKEIVGGQHKCLSCIVTW